ncbi:MAG TPA: acyl carrier protein [Gaiellaceae bacterium]|nr:acyl carrier protein [Gaiellaceae bacterium]
MTANARIREFVVSELMWGGDPADLGEDTSLIDNGVIDSLGIVKLVLFLEREFGIKVRDEELSPATFDSISSIASFVESKAGS